jgi:hypothetical protein
VGGDPQRSLCVPIGELIQPPDYHLECELTGTIQNILNTRHFCIHRASQFIAEMLTSTSGSLWGREIGARALHLPSEWPRYSKPIQPRGDSTWASNYRAYFSALRSCVTNKSLVETNGSVSRAPASGPPLLTAKDGCLLRVQSTRHARQSWVDTMATKNNFHRKGQAVVLPDPNNRAQQRGDLGA